MVYVGGEAFSVKSVNVFSNTCIWPFDLKNICRCRAPNSLSHTHTHKQIHTHKTHGPGNEDEVRPHLWGGKKNNYYVCVWTLKIQLEKTIKNALTHATVTAIVRTTETGRVRVTDKQSKREF